MWPHMTLIAVAVAVIAGVGTALWMKHRQTTYAAEQLHAGQIQRVEGQVAFSDQLPNSDTEQWVAATPNQPFSAGDRIYTRDNSRTSLAFSGRNFARLDPNTSLDIVSLEERRTQLALREGSAIFDVGYLADDELFEVATPYGAVNFDQPGLYNVGFDDNGGVLVSVLSGLASVVGLGGSGEINKGELLTILGQTAAEVALSRLNGEDAGYLVDDYYRYQYPDAYDGRYSNYDAYLSDPYYYDPYRHSSSYQYVNSSIPGIYDLDHYGDWQNIDGYGYAWRPRVDTGWVPYQHGYWTNDYPYGPTWVSSEPWGYAPYHYGRWANMGNQWYWIPDGVNTTPTYAPALVAFVPLEANQIGWVPLGPGDVYAPRYYDDGWQPHYLTGADVVPAQLVNFGVPGALTVVPIDTFGRVIEPRLVHRVDHQRFTSVNSTLDPLTLTPLRNAVVNSAWGRGKIDLPPGIAKRLRDTPVFLGTEVRGSKFRKDVAKSLRVERVSDQAKNQKLKVKDVRGERRDSRDVRDETREGRVNDEGKNKTDGRRIDLRDRQVDHQVPQVERQSRNEARKQQRAQQPSVQPKAERAQPQPRGERVGNPVRPKAQPRVQQPKRERVDNPARSQPRAQPRVQQQPKAERVGNPARSQPKAQTRVQQQPKAERVGNPARSQQKAQPRQEPNKPAAQGNPAGGKAKGKGKP